ncbi:TIM21-domain-containing protein [Immersiella caudata]|uniref:Mitochondrial import inner membrane translocase subunit Tim21 n=1 Tax=Immersiella caudata TaxID=314043 RepID=A0AA40C7X0_9PEZI|nr:TIM21-domain-containing protein [Immersiella caudata]
MMNRLTASSRLSLRASPTAILRTILPRRTYASQNPQQPPPSSRRSVTPFNDDGRVPWSHLSATEKNWPRRPTNLQLRPRPPYLFYQEVISPDSKTAYFNRAVDRIKKDARCVELLGDGRKITAYGEETFNKWRRARPIASTVTKDGRGNEHLRVHFNVAGPKGTGVVQMHLVRRAGEADFEYKYFFVDVKGQSRIYLENADASSAGTGDKAKGFRLFGVKWS